MATRPRRRPVGCHRWLRTECSDVLSVRALLLIRRQRSTLYRGEVGCNGPNPEGPDCGRRRQGHLRRRARPGRLKVAVSQGLLEVLPELVHVFESDAEPDEALW